MKFTAILSTAFAASALLLGSLSASAADTSFVGPTAQNDQSAFVLFYDGSFNQSVNVSVDGVEKTSMNAGKYSVINTCSGNHVLGGDINGVSDSNPNAPKLSTNLEPNSVMYVAVSINPVTNKPAFTAVDERFYLDELSSMDKDSVNSLHPMSCS